MTKQIRYTGPSGHGVEIVVPDGRVVFPPGEPVEVPDELADSLTASPVFEAAPKSAPTPSEPSAQRPKRSKQEEAE